MGTGKSDLPDDRAVDIIQLKIFGSLFYHFSVCCLYVDINMGIVKIGKKKVLLIMRVFEKLYLQQTEVDGDLKPLVCEGSLVVYLTHVGGFSLVTLGQMFKPLKPPMKLALVIGKKLNSLSWESFTMEKNYLRKKKCLKGPKGGKK